MLISTDILIILIDLLFAGKVIAADSGVSNLPGYSRAKTFDRHEISPIPGWNFVGLSYGK